VSAATWVRSVTTVVRLRAQIAAWLTASGFVSRTPLSTAAFVAQVGGLQRRVDALSQIAGCPVLTFVQRSIRPQRQHDMSNHKPAAARRRRQTAVAS
jgi:hypothetical protein